MKIALVVPNSDLKLNNACVPMNLAFLANYLRAKMPSVDVKIFDGVTSEHVDHQLFFYQPNIVGITFTTPQAPYAYHLADTLKHNRPDIFIIMGGVHASAIPKEASEHCDCVVIGEGEKALVDIIHKRKLDVAVPKIIEADYIRNLDEIPIPAYDLVNVKEYLKHGPPFPGLKHPIMSLVTSRGCPHRCPFCRNSWRQEPVRYFSAKRVLDEILLCHNHYGVCDFFFNDDEFIINKKRLRELAQLFEKYGITHWIRWGCQARVNTLDLETLKLAKRMGCVVVSPGFESGTQRILNYLKCGTTTIEANERALTLAKQANIIIGGSFIFGSPTETLEEMKQTFAWFENHKDMKFIGINTIIPFPGTDVWHYALSHNLLPEKVNYKRLVPTSVPSKTYIINRTVPAKTFNRFVTDIQHIAWVLTQVRLGRGFWRLARFKTWWWMWLRYPIKMLRLIIDDLHVKRVNP